MHTSPEAMAHMRAARGPYSDPRAGRVLQTILYCWHAAGTDIISSSTLLDWAYPTFPTMGVTRKKWQYQTLINILRKVAVPIGRKSGKGAGTGRPQQWQIIPEKVQERGWLGKTNRRRAREGKPPIDGNGY